MPDRHPTALILLLAICVVASISACAQEVLQTQVAAHVSRLPQLRALLQQCVADTTKCKPESVGPDERFKLQNGTETQVHYGWLRQTLKAMGTQKPEERQVVLRTGLEKLALDGDPAVREVPISADRVSQVASQVLSQVEFSKSKPSWLAKQWDRFSEWLDKHVNVPVPSHGTSRWLRYLVEAVLFGTPILLLMLWLLRQAREDRLRPESPAKDRSSKKTDAETAWIDVAQECARRGEWREAVHALYWQTISTLEGRRLLSVSRSRTPRESLRLLDSTSPARPVLREQTMLLEQVWYGRHAATEQDYQRARHLQEELQRA